MPNFSVSSATHRAATSFETPPLINRSYGTANDRDATTASVSAVFQNFTEAATALASDQLTSGWTTRGTNVTRDVPPNRVQFHMPGIYNVSMFDEFLLWDNSSGCSFNDSLCWYNITNATQDSGGEETERGPVRLWAVVLSLFPMFTIFGNILVVLSVYRERSLKTVTNYFIVSLALADIFVAVMVMPLAVYVEVNNGTWELGNIICDAWVAFDVMGCTSSILNLTAISVDRFIAVTQPIKYARHKNSKRVHIMLIMTWLISLIIASPIALGMNYSPERTKDSCQFYNSDFIIYSSMGSFYIPCIIMIILYWRIFKAIRERAKKIARVKKTKVLENKSAHKQMLDNAPNVVNYNDRTPECSQIASISPKHRTSATINTTKFSTLDVEDNTTYTNANVDGSFSNMGSSTSEPNEPADTDTVKSAPSEDTDNVIPNNKAAEAILSPLSEDSPLEFHPEGDSGYSAPATVEVGASKFTVANRAVTGSPGGFLGRKRAAARNNVGPKIAKLKAKKLEKQNKTVTKFNFHLRHSKKKKDKSSSRRERKATKTLAIVLGVFLFCWVPFFTVNLLNAFCIRYKLVNHPMCDLAPELFSFFVWLGYINSFLNPAIYTIFNIEFRRAFKKLLTEPCNRRKR